MRFPLSALFATVAILLGACGGGGGGGQATNQPPAPAGTPGDFTLSASTVSFAAQQGAASPTARTITVHLLDTKAAALGAAYVAPQTQPAWLNVSITGTAPDYSVVLTPSTTAMAAGSASAVLTLGTADAAGVVLQSKPVQVSLTVTPSAFVVLPAKIVIGGADGMGRESESLQFSLATGTNQVPWSATTATESPSNWLSLSATSGMVGQSGTTITVNGDRTLVPPGSYKGTIFLESTINDQLIRQVVPVVLNKELHDLYVSALGVALSSFPSRKVLTRTLQVTSTQERKDVAWTAVSDQPWLTVTASGLTGGGLTLNADAAGLQNDRLYLATVSVTSTDKDVQNEQRVRVALWVNSNADPQDVSLSTTAARLIANPVEPYVYAHSFGNDITVYNVYTGATVTTFNFGAKAGDMAISDDGAVLYVMDMTTMAVVAIDSTSGAEIRRYSYAPGKPEGLAYARPNAHPVLAIANGWFFDATTGVRFQKTLPEIYGDGYARLAVHPGGRRLYYVTRSYTPANVIRHDIGYSALVSDYFTLLSKRSSTTDDARDLCLSADGSRLYTSNYTGGYNFKAYDALTLKELQTLPAIAYPTNAKCAWNGLFVGTADTGPNPENLWVYRADGTLVSNVALAPGLGTASSPYSLSLSGDNTRLVIPVGSVIAFRNLPSP